MKCKKIFCAGLAASMALTLPAQAAGKPLSAYPAQDFHALMPPAFAASPETFELLIEQLSAQNPTAFGALDFSRLDAQTLNTLNTLRAFGMTETDIANAVQTAAAADTVSSDSGTPATDTNTGTDADASNETVPDNSAANPTDTTGENDSGTASENTDAPDENISNDAGETPDIQDSSNSSDMDNADDNTSADVPDDAGSDLDNQDIQTNPEPSDDSDAADSDTNNDTENTAPEEIPGHESEDNNKEPAQDTDSEDKTDADISSEDNNSAAEDLNASDGQNPAETDTDAVNPETPAEKTDAINTETPDDSEEPGIDEQVPDEEEILTDEEELLAEEPIIRVAVKDVGRIAINPYRMKVPVNGETSCEQVINTEQVLVSTSNVPVAVNVTAVGHIASGSHAVFVTEPPAEDTSDKEIFLYAEFLPCESESGEADWSGAYRSADNQLVVTSDGQSKDAVMALEAGTEETPVYGAYRIFGSLSEHPSERWTADDAIRVNLAFTFTQISESNS